MLNNEQEVSTGPDLNALREAARIANGEMPQKRREEIALLIVEDQMRQKGFKLAPDFKRSLGDMAKRINISTEEMVKFAEPIARKLYEEAFGKK